MLLQLSSTFIGALALIGVAAICCSIGAVVYLFVWPQLRKPGEPDFMSNAVDLVLAERQHQILDKGYTPQSDSAYKDDELAIMASCYLYAPRYPFNVASGKNKPNQWPVLARDWKPGSSRIRQLQKAAALAIAEIERELRKEYRTQQAFNAAQKKSNGKHVT